MSLKGKDIEKIIKKEGKEWDWPYLADALSDTKLPFRKPIILKSGTTIWGFCSIHPGAKIGKKVVIGAFTNICGPVEIGDECRLQGFNYIPNGVILERRVFVGPGVVFTNIKYPTVRFGSWGRIWENTHVGEKASIGAGAVICPGVTIGKYALVAAGAVVTSNVMDGWLVKGSPARHIRQAVDYEDEQKQAKAWHIEGK